MGRSPDFFRQLNEQLLEQLEEVARQPGKTGDEILEWLTDKGVKASRSSVYRWLQDFRLEDRARRASDVARTYLQVAEASDPQAVTEASLRKFNELVFDALASGEELDTGDLMKLSIALKTGLNAQQLVNELKKNQREAIAVAEKLANSGAQAMDVVSTIKQALGIAA